MIYQELYEVLKRQRTMISLSRLPIAGVICLLLIDDIRAFQFHPSQPSCVTTPRIRTNVAPLCSSLQNNLGAVGTTNIKYPTLRGSEIDSRKIVSEPLLALRVGHVLFASEELARQSLDKLTTAEWNFEQMASVLSNCAETRDEGGNIGWVNLAESFHSPQSEDIKNPNRHLDLILPPSARQQLLATPTKPGDVVLVTSERGVHVVQVMDVMLDVRRLSFVKARNNSAKKQPLVYSNDMEVQGGNSNVRKGSKLAGVLGGALLDGSDDRTKVDLTYKIETMGCQMNSADSERIEGQLMSLGIRPLGEEEFLVSLEDSEDGGKKNKREKRKPDVIVLNTCSIRDHAEQKVYSYLGPYAKRKRAGEDVTIIVAGCVAQQEGQSLLRRIPEIDLVMGPQYANRISDLLEDVANGNQVVATEASHIMEDSTKPRRQSSTCAWVNVIYDCNESCTY
ncbi:hypothetical protein ACHAWX_003570 [Stephanocyclus meneghinianus]